MATILVGVDGSACADAALEVAAAEAALRGARLLVVSAWQVPPNVAMVAGAYPDIFDSFRLEAEDVVSKAVSRVAALEPGVDCEGRAEEGRPGEVLLQQARKAELVVVGSRGRGGFTGLLLGSVSQQVVRDSRIPVLVVPPPEDAGC
jgi:nucleotide-binding universal stress UspA family protein